MNADKIQVKSQTGLSPRNHAEHGDFKTKITAAGFLGELHVLCGLFLIFIGVNRRLSAAAFSCGASDFSVGVIPAQAGIHRALIGRAHHKSAVGANSCDVHREECKRSGRGSMPHGFWFARE